MEYITQIIIAVVTTSLGSILTYFQATKKFKTDLETVKINSETEQQIKLMIAESDIASKQNE